MKALVYCGEQSVRQVDVDAPVIASPDVSVRVLQAGICGTDIGAVRYGRPVLAPRMTLGHEFVGRREDTGQLVVGNPLLSCGLCRNCRDGRMHLCEKRVVIGVHRPGAFAETVAWPTSHLVDAGTATLAQAAMSDPIATALHAFHLADKPQGPVAVLGAGAIGLSMLFVLKSLGVQDVTVTDISRERLDLALAAGADRVDTAISGVFDVVYDTAGTEQTRQDAVLKVRAGGTAVLVGLHAAQLNVPAGPLIGGERTIRGSFGYTEAEFRESVRMASQLDTRWVHTVDFDAAEAAFDALLRGRSDPSHVKIQMHMA